MSTDILFICRLIHHSQFLSHQCTSRAVPSSLLLIRSLPAKEAVVMQCQAFAYRCMVNSRNTTRQLPKRLLPSQYRLRYSYPMESSTHPFLHLLPVLCLPLTALDELALPRRFSSSYEVGICRSLLQPYFRTPACLG